MSTCYNDGYYQRNANDWQPPNQQSQRSHASLVSSTTGGNLSTTATVGHAHSSSYTTTGAYLSDIELAILKSAVPINLPDTEEITVLGHRGIWANKAEVVNWRGPRPISEYPINVDDAPEVLTKRTQETLTYIQELAVRYLKPPSPPPPGEIIIQQEANSFTPPAPPLIIRQQPPRPSTPEPLVIREAPPPVPPRVGRKVITISGKRLPPPPRKVVIERLAPLPPKPQSVIIERWLPYTPVKRRVIFHRTAAPEPVVVKPRNIIVQWEAPQVQIRKDFKYLGIIRANPVEYVQRYGNQLKTSQELPSFVLDIKPPEGIVLAADYQYNQVHELEGDIEALRLVDLEREGLGEYRSQLNAYLSSNPSVGQQRHPTAATLITNSTNVHVVPPPLPPSPPPPASSLPLPPPPPTPPQPPISHHNHHQQSNDPLQPIQYNPIPHVSPYPPHQSPYPSQSQPQHQQPKQPPFGLINPPGTYSTSSIKSYNSNMLDIVGEIFSQVADSRVTTNGRLSLEEAEKLLLKLNSRLGRRYSEDDLRRFFYSLNIQQDGTISLEEFRIAFERVL